MKARLVPLYFTSADDADFSTQSFALRGCWPPRPTLAPASAARASPCPQRKRSSFRRCWARPSAAWTNSRPSGCRSWSSPPSSAPSRCGTGRSTSSCAPKGSPSSRPTTWSRPKAACRLLALSRELQGAKFIVYQDNPGEGFQASIFKRFYWWEDECTAAHRARSACEIVKRSFKDPGRRGQAIPDAEARRRLGGREHLAPLDSLPRAQPAQRAQGVPGGQARPGRASPQSSRRGSTASTSRTSPTPPPAWPGTCSTKSAGWSGAARPTPWRC